MAITPGIQSTQIQPTQEELREAQLVQRFGRRVHENSPFRTTAPERIPHTDDEMMAFDRLRLKGGLWDPKKPEKGDEEFVWKIVSFTLRALGTDEDHSRVIFMVQKCWRNKFIQVRSLIEIPGSEPDRGEPEQVNEPWKRYKITRDRRGRETGRELRDTGECLMDASDFVEKFKRVKDELDDE
jgi:hypothetical protein